MVGILAICKFVGYIHEFWHSRWLDAPHLLNEFRTVEPSNKSVDHPLIGDIFG
jgi:hypothetical protein